MEKILTISIAAFNMQDYIERAIKSLLDKRIIDALEIFIIDDGGSDSTLEIAGRYAKIYPDSVFAVHKENGGYGSTVNYSIAHARGKYFKLLDGDDWFDKDGLYQLVETLKIIDDDVIVMNHCEGSSAENLRLIKRSDLKPNESIAINKKYHPKDSFPNVQIAYKLTLLRQSRLYLPEHLLYTDNLYVAIPYTYAGTIYYIDCCVYCYWRGRDDQSINRKSIQKHIDEHGRVCQMLAERYELEKLNQVNLNMLYLRYVTERVHRTTFKWFLVHLPFSRKTIKRAAAFDRSIKKVSRDIYFGAASQGKWGILLRLFRMSSYFLYYPFKVAWVIKEKVFK